VKIITDVELFLRDYCSLCVQHTDHHCDCIERFGYINIPNQCTFYEPDYLLRAAFDDILYIDP